MVKIAMFLRHFVLVTIMSERFLGSLIKMFDCLEVM